MTETLPEDDDQQINEDQQFAMEYVRELGRLDDDAPDQMHRMRQEARTYG